MAKGKTLRLSIRLIRGGRYAPANRIRYADSYEVWLGKRRLRARRSFPKGLSRAQDRRDLLHSLLESIVRKIQTKQEKRKAQAQRKRQARKRREEETRTRRKERARVKRSERRPIKKGVQPEDRKIGDLFREYLKKESLDVENTHAEEPQTLKQATIEDVTIIPIKTPSKLYKKRLVEKMIWTGHMASRLDLSILDFDLHESLWVPLDEESMFEAFARLTELMFPHVLQFWRETVHSSDAYIFRFKFQWEYTPGKFVSHGVSLRRQDIHSAKTLAGVFIATFHKLLGGNPDKPNRKPKNYLANQILIFMTGFTLEATTKD